MIISSVSTQITMIAIVASVRRFIDKLHDPDMRLKWILLRTDPSRERLQEMLSVQPARPQLRSIFDHHQEDLLSFFVDRGDFVKIDDAFLGWRTLAWLARA